MSPARKGVAVLGAVLAVTVGGGLVTEALLPDATGMQRALVVTVVLTGMVVAVAPRWGGWAGLGVTGPAQWRRPALLVLPLLLALSPLAFGVRSVPAAELLVLVAGYLLTGFYEELLWRGLVQRFLAPLAPLRGVLLGAALFGLSHLGNVLYRDSVGLVLAQAWGAFCFGVGYAALRRRVGSVVPLMALHALTDLCAAVTAGPTIPLLVAQDVVLLTLGLVLVTRPERRRPNVPLATVAPS